jgi:hypothetical protein
VPSRSQIQVAVGIAALVWAGLLLAEGIKPTLEWTRPYGAAVGAVIISFLIYDRFLWRKRPLGIRITNRPVIHGTWLGRLRSTYVDPETGRMIDPNRVFLVVRQTYSTVTLALLSANSQSSSIVAALDQPARGQCVISSMYMNVPKLLLQDQSRIHRGSMIIEVHGSPPKRLEGFYWTDRDTKGEVEFWAHSPKLYSDFESASSDPLLSSAG